MQSLAIRCLSRHCLSCPNFIVVMLLASTLVSAQNFTNDKQTASVHGVHQISLLDSTAYDNPFDIHADILFYPPESSQPIKVPMFYDGSHAWRGRTYVTVPGLWNWKTQSDRAALNNQSGSFTARPSDLPGKLRKHPENQKAFANQRGKTFINIADTAYYLFSGDPAADTWREFITEDYKLGIRMLRALSLGDFDAGLFEVDADLEVRDRAGNDSENPHQKGRDAEDFNPDILDVDRPNLVTFHRTERRLRWMLNNVPGMYVQFILFQFEHGWKEDESFWASLTPLQKDRVLRQYVARYAAFPQILWEVHNDLRYEPEWNNTKAAHEIGNYLLQNDPWNTLISTGAYRDAPFPFPDAPWVSYIHLETLNATAADQVADYSHLPMPVFNGEDRYEEYRGPAHPRPYYRRIMWAWLLSGSSATYGQRWHDDDGATLNQPLTPYSLSGYTGLDSVKLIRPFFENHDIDLALFQDADHLALDTEGRNGPNRPQVAIRPGHTILIYHPNATEYKGSARPDAGVYAGLTLDLTGETGPYLGLWFDAHDGKTSPAGTIQAGRHTLLRAPWPGTDVVLLMKRYDR